MGYRPGSGARPRGDLSSRAGRLLPLVLLLLLLLLSPQVRASPTRHDGGEAGQFEEPSWGNLEDAAARDGCRGPLDICCRSSSATAAYGHYSGQQSFTPSSASASALLGQTMKLVRPLLAMAAGAWCPSAGRNTPPPMTTTSTLCTASQWWHGFSGIRHVFSFGDSYTTTEFKHTQLPYPSPADPLGNPPYPGRTSANGPNWIDYFTVRYNHSVLQTYNLAYGGATVDSSIVPPYLPSVLSLKGQILDEFVPGYAEHQAPGAPAWTAGDTLFAIWMGINDVNGAYTLNDTDAINQRVFREYAELVRTLYGHGARNFAFLNVPAIERSPLTRDKGEEAVRLEGADLAQFNSLLGDMARGLRAEHADANVWVYDSYADFDTVMDDPSAFPQTSGYKNTEDFCDAYQNGTPDPDYFDPACGIRANEYLWSNSLHPTDPVHELVAARVAELLVAGPNIC